MLKKSPSLAAIYMATIFLQLVWGITPSASKLVIQEIPVELYITIRWTISGCVFLGIFLWLKYRKKQWRWNFPIKSIGLLMLLGIFGYAGASFGTLYSMKLGGVTNFVFMGALSPMITSITAILILKERPNKLFFVALPLSLLGLAVVIFGKYNISSLTIALSSALLAVGAGVLEALVFTSSKRLKQNFSVVEYLALAQLSAAGLMWILQIFFFHQTMALPQLTLMGWSSLLFVSIGSCVFCYGILYWLLNFIEGHRLALFDGIHTLSGVTFGYVFFAEQITPTILMGGSLVLAGLLIGNWSDSKKNSKPPVNGNSSASHIESVSA